MTPLMLLCSTGLADCVMLLADLGANFGFTDDSLRGCWQLASNAQGDNQKLATWLKWRFPELQWTYGQGRRREDKSRGEGSERYRNQTGPRVRESRTYHPSQGRAVSNTWQSSEWYGGYTPQGASQASGWHCYGGWHQSDPPFQ